MIKLGSINQQNASNLLNAFALI